MFEQLVFYAFAAGLLFAATMVITVRNPVHAALFLVVAFFASAGLWMLLEAEFLAIALSRGGVFSTWVARAAGRATW